MRRSRPRPKPTGVIHNPEWSRPRKLRHYVPHALGAAGLAYLAILGVESFGSSTYLTPSHEGSIPQGPSAGDLKKRPTNPFHVKWDKTKIPHDPAYKGTNKCPWTPEHQAPTKELSFGQYGGREIKIGGAVLQIRCFNDPAAHDGRAPEGDPTKKHFYTYAQPSILPEQKTRFDAGPTQNKYYSKRVYTGCLVRGEVETDTNGFRTDAWVHLLAVKDPGQPAEILSGARIAGSQLFVPYAATGYAEGLPQCPTGLGFAEPPKPPSTWEKFEHFVDKLVS